MSDDGRVLVVGGNGFIGSHLVDRLLADGKGVRILDQRADPLRRTPRGAECMIGPCGRAAMVRKAARGCEVIVYLAHHATPVSSARHPLGAITRSVTPFVDFLRYVDWSGVRLFIYVSTGGAIYGNVMRGRASERSLPHPLSPYGVSKLAMESYLRMFAHQSGVPCMILRPSNVYGPRQNYAGDHGLVAVSLGRFLSGQTVHVWGGGGAVKDYLFVDDMVEGTVGLMDRGKAGEVYNLGSERGTRVSEILEIAGRLTGGKGRVVHEPGHTYDVRRVVLCCSKVRSATGWKARIQLEDGMRRTLEWILRDMIRSRRAGRGPGLA